MPITYDTLRTVTTERDTMTTPTMIYETPDGEIYEAVTYDGIVEQMAQGKMTEPRSMASYRKATAKRIKRLLDLDIDPTNSETFVLGMIAADLLRRI